MFQTAIHTMITITRKSVYTVRYSGLQGLYRKARKVLFPAPIYQQSWSKTYASEALTLAQWLDCTPEDLRRSRALTSMNQGFIDIKTVNWYLPHFDHAYYGGIYTILRFAAHLAKNYNVKSSFIILGDANAPDAATYIERISTVFAELKESHAVVIRSDIDLPGVPSSDVCIATLWSTAYYVLKFNQTRRKFYFIQDFEPMFYPAGSTSAQVETSYRFGFYGITNTITLKQHYEQDYGGDAVSFNPCVDTAIFNPSTMVNKRHQNYRVFFYARPHHWRNGFELGAIALRKLKERLGAKVEIIAAGQLWDPEEYGLSGIVENLGLLSYHQTADIYRSCDAGLVMMFTRHPSYLPFELMASGCLVITNINSATSWLLKDGENCLLTLPTASCIADTIARGLQNEDLRQSIVNSALNDIKTHFSDWDAQIDHVYQYMCRPEI